MIFSNEDVPKINIKEFMVIFQDAKVDEMILELHEKSNQILCEDSSLFQGENVNKGANLERDSIRPYSNYFFTFFFDEI